MMIDFTFPAVLTDGENVTIPMHRLNNLSSNHNKDIIIHPQKGKRENILPGYCLLLVTPAEAAVGHALLRDNGGREQFLYHSRLTVAEDTSLCIAGPAIGAPLAAMILEKLIVLGVSRVILYGWCGAIDPALSVGDVVISARALSGEGTSSYYRDSTTPVKPSRQLVLDIVELLRSKSIHYAAANFWSTDAPYREDRIYLDKLHQSEDVKCVDMEYSALCAVAEFRQIELAGVFLVSDELYRESWKPGFTSKEFKKKSKEMVQLLSTLPL